MSSDPGNPRSRSEIERIAEGWRKALDPQDSWAPDMMDLIARAGREYKAVRGLRVVFLPNEDMSDDEARTEFLPLRICLRQSLEHQARNNEPRVRSTLAHELGHAVLHSGIAKSRKSNGVGKIAYMAIFKRHEAEAWTFARAFLLPSWKLAQVTTSQELALRSRVSFEFADIRFAQGPLSGSPRSVPPEVQLSIDTLRSLSYPTSEDPRIKAERERVRAWSRARHVAGENPLTVRRSDDPGTGFRIELREYGNALSPFGWFVADGRAFAYFAKDH